MTITVTVTITMAVVMRVRICGGCGPTRVRGGDGAVIRGSEGMALIVARRDHFVCSVAVVRIRGHVQLWIVMMNVVWLPA